MNARMGLRMQTRSELRLCWAQEGCANLKMRTRCNHRATTIGLYPPYPRLKFCIPPVLLLSCRDVVGSQVTMASPNLPASGNLKRQRDSWKCDCCRKKKRRVSDGDSGRLPALASFSFSRDMLKGAIAVLSS